MPLRGEVSEPQQTVSQAVTYGYSSDGLAVSFSANDPLLPYGSFRD
ncbi:MAG: hypothetical protein V7608_946 [Hyphomicrobiales bacterium]|jgi:hypothetical protein